MSALVCKVHRMFQGNIFFTLQVWVRTICCTIRRALTWATLTQQLLFGHIHLTTSPLLHATMEKLRTNRFLVGALLPRLAHNLRKSAYFYHSLSSLSDGSPIVMKVSFGG